MGEKQFVRSCSDSFNNKLLVMILCLVAGAWNSAIAAGTGSTKHWVGTWAAAPYNTQAANKPPTAFDDKTLRQIVRVSIGGDSVRVKFSNITCTTPVIMKSVTIAASPDGTKSAVTASTITKLTFNGDSSVTINAKSEVVSDPVAFDLKPSMRVAITIYYGQCKSTDDMTFHYGSRTNSYYISGNHTASADLSGATSIERWFTIWGIDVLAPKSAVAVAAIGNSITDGSTLSGGLQNRWTDMFSEALLKNEVTNEVGVLNLGIGATLVTDASNGAEAGTVRFKHDILGQAGLQWVIIFYGVNDINSGKSANVILDGIKKMADEAHAKDSSIKVYGATITPLMGHTQYGTAGNETVRKQINEKIRGNLDYLDGFIDFDKAVRNPSDTSKFQQSLQSDWLHPNAAGHKVMGESIDLAMFTPPPVRIIGAETARGRMEKGLSATFINRNSAISFTLPGETFVSLKVYSLLGKQITELAGKNFPSGKHTVEFTGVNLVNGTYLFSIKAGEFSECQKMVISGR